MVIRTSRESHARKAKGERLQLEIRDKIRNFFPDQVIESQKMSAHGEDILMDDTVRRSLPVSFECKKAKSGFAPTYNALYQACRQVANMPLPPEEKPTPIGIIQQDGLEPVAVIRIDDLFNVFLSNMESEKEVQSNGLH